MGKMWIGETNGCWIDVWDGPNFTGNHCRLFGPADFPYLRIAEPGWHPQVQSLVVGPNAYAQFYEDLNFHDSVFWALPNQRVEEIANLGCNDAIDSLRIYDRPPFAHEPGYAAYMLRAASHLTRASASGLSQAASSQPTSSQPASSQGASSQGASSQGASSQATSAQSGSTHLAQPLTALASSAH
jgi:hypothetical protein